ncbi:MAG: type III-B CRISPR-associated protein Cas10/Cmr2 [Verrucomicrobiales bacterium]
MNYWKRKIAAYLHDSPEKVVNILDHEHRARALSRTEEYNPEAKGRKEADWAASAADRLPWPLPAYCRSDFNASFHALKHPLGGSSISFDNQFHSSDEALTISHANKPEIGNGDPRSSFISIWKFWQNWASAADERFAFLPAETRLPDHTIWNHLSVTSALQGCFGGSIREWIEATASGNVPPPLLDRPAFLLFSIGPVQDFIAAARNTRDLWSGSYLLSYFAGSALSRIALDFGPDHVVFPTLAGQPIIDLLLKKELWDQVKTAAGDDLWKAFGYDTTSGKERLLTPSLPNRFMALLPSQMSEHGLWRTPDEMGRTGAAKYAAHLELVIRRQLRKIAESVRDLCGQHIPEFDAHRFDHQVTHMLDIHWQILPWPDDVEEGRQMAIQVPGIGENHALDSLDAIQAMLDRMPVEHRDRRYFKNANVGTTGNAGRLNQTSNAWSALYALAAWRLDGLKATRAFAAWSEGGWNVGIAQNKDSLNGKEEACLIVPKDSESFSFALAENRHAFKPGDRLGASTLIKRLWHRTWLSKTYDFNLSDFGMPNTRSIADHHPFASDIEHDNGSGEEGKYFAVLALDGDEMGKWISGFKCPELKRQLSKEASDYFSANGNEGFLKARRPLSPSFHLQFSELLGNFSLHCARRIVEAFNGRLIYAGGDDVLAMLPADTALACARALRAAFRGELELPALAEGIIQRSGRRDLWSSDSKSRIFQVKHNGFIKLTMEAAPAGYGAKAGLVDEPVQFAFMTPGPSTDCSVGIAIAHYKAPLQDVVREAQAAEKRAKSILGRKAVAVTVMKKGGEINQWGFQWASGGFELIREIQNVLEKGEVSAKFPHRVISLLQPYVDNRKSGAASMDKEFSEVAVEIIQRDVALALERQSQAAGSRTIELTEKISNLLHHYLESITSYLQDVKPGIKKEEIAPIQIEAVIGLCRTVAFAHRIKDDRISKEKRTESNKFTSAIAPA